MNIPIMSKQHWCIKNNFSQSPSVKFYHHWMGLVDSTIELTLWWRYKHDTDTLILLYATYLRWTNNWQENRETHCKYYSVQLTSLNKKGRSTDTVFTTNSELRITSFHFDKILFVQFKERGNVLLRSTKRGRGTDRILLRQQFLGTLNISNLRR